MTSPDRRTGERRRPDVEGHRPPVQRERRRAERRQMGSDGRFLERRQLPRPQRVLLVDDDADVRTVWREWLTLWRFSVIEAENGAAAVDVAQQHHPDLVLMDVTMPVLNGLSATMLLKQHPETARVPVLLMTADAAGGAPKRAALAGADILLSKPLRAHALLETIRAAFRRVIAARSATAAGETTAL